MSVRSDEPDRLATKHLEAYVTQNDDLPITGHQIADL